MFLATEMSNDAAKTARANRALRKHRQYQICLHPHAGAVCSSKFAAAHTIQRRGDGLARISRDGHVYGYVSDLFALTRNDGFIQPGLIGIREASTFTGFCSTHDEAIFRELEKKPFVASPLQVGLLAYRAFCHALWKKRVKLSSHDLLAEQIRGSANVARRISESTQLRAMKAADYDDLALAERLKSDLDAMLLSGKWSSLRALVLWVNQTPPVLACGSTYPRYDFAGQKLQDLAQPNEALDVLAISSIATGEQGAFVFAWRREGRASQLLAQSLAAVRRQEQPAAVMRFIFEHIENYFIAPQWWDDLPKGQRNLLLNHMNNGRGPRRPHMPHWFDRARRLDTGLKITKLEFT